MKRVVVLSGAGISAESGLQTFRGADGLWEGRRVEDVAVELVAEADILLVVGTSLQVYPAAGLVFEAPRRARRILVNPDVPERVAGAAFEAVVKPATVGVPEVVARLLAEGL